MAYGESSNNFLFIMVRAVQPQLQLGPGQTSTQLRHLFDEYRMTKKVAGDDLRDSELLKILQVRRPTTTGNRRDGYMQACAIIRRLKAPRQRMCQKGDGS